MKTATGDLATMTKMANAIGTIAKVYISHMRWLHEGRLSRDHYTKLVEIVLFRCQFIVNLHESDSIILRVVLAIIDVHQQFITMKKQKFGSYSKIMFVCSCGW